MKTIINLTPHSINIVGQEPLPPSGVIARVAVQRSLKKEINGIKTYSPIFGEVENLPKPEKDTVYIVSAMVRNHPAIIARKDVFSPGTPVRDDAGNIIGCDGLDGN